MHLRTMTLQALGPFAGTHTIDFAELGASGLYLLEGPTGAGKSTIIDAVVFALYGKVASAATSDDRLRSGYATDDVDTVVDLVFETGSGVYRVRRTPERLRAKKRGAGTTKQQATIKLWRLADPDDVERGELLSTRLDEAGAEIQRVIGLDRAQFVQTIVLPQGEFASFLRADPEQRRGLLQKVFGTEVYERVQDRLVLMRREAQGAVDAARSAVGAAAAHFVGAASVTDEPDFAIGRARAARGAAGAPADEALATATELRALGEAADPRLLSAARAHVTALTHEAEQDAGADHAARAAAADARAALDAARVVAEALRRRDALRAEHADLMRRHDEHLDAVARRDAARRAAVVASLLAGAERAAAAVEESQARVRTLQATAPDLVDLHGTDLAAARESLAAEAARLERVERLERALPSRRRALSHQEGMLAAEVAEQAALRAEMAARPGLRRVLTDAIEALGDPGAELAARRAEHATTQERLAAARRVDVLQEELAIAQRTVEQAVRAAQEAVGVETALRRRRLSGMAGELAAALHPGDPCPVCGGCEHPAPAPLATDHPDEDEVAAAERRREAAEAASTAAAARATTLTERIAAQRAVAGTGASADLEAALATLAIHIREAEGAQDRLRRTRRELQAHDSETDVLLDRLRTLDVTVASRQASLEGLVTALEADAKEVDTARFGAATVAVRLAEVQEQVGALRGLADALAESAAASQDLLRRTAELNRGLAEQGFPDATRARDAQLPSAVLRRLEEETARHATAVARVEEALAEPALAAVVEDTAADLPAAERACADAERAAAAASRQATLSARCAHAARAGLTEVESALAAHAAARRTAEPVVRMADLASASGGDNAQRLTLATYVLTRRFEDVVAAANDRLVQMSDGRFELVRSDEREDVGSRKRGLAMKVLDHRIEAERDPRTLSGGETFYVSLCLALGMADVVTAEAGGIDLGTLFVDEGFGTLDPETLEAVLAELGRLRAGGRVVGVVSHVETLKQSIAERIEVRRLTDGSSTLTVRAG